MGSPAKTTRSKSLSKPLRSGPGRPAGKSEDTMRRRLLAVALQAFASKGFDGASLSAIARAADATPPLVNYYFGSKEGLWHAAVTAAFEELRASFAEIEAELRNIDPATALKIYVRRFIRFSARRPEVALVLTNENREDGPRLQWLLESHVAPLQGFLLKLIIDGQALGVFREGRPESIVEIIIGACTHAILTRPMMRVLHGVDPCSEEYVDEHTDLVVETVLYGLVQR
ncbi:MAG: TetR/AcrR family transcriptional regulator [Hyphomicrobiaceae bacterium]|jgi:TetR/AcrR family transcriptional regulator